jgi:hypothetical protein
MLGWQQKALWCSHIFLHPFTAWIENTLHAIFSSKFGSFIHVLKKIGVGLASLSNICVFW